MQVKHVYDWIVPYWHYADARGYTIDTMIDINTGVHYVFAHDYERNSAGCYGYGYGGLSVRYNSDGKPFVSSLNDLKRHCKNWVDNCGKSETEYHFHLSDGELIYVKQ